MKIAKKRFPSSIEHKRQVLKHVAKGLGDLYRRMRKSKIGYTDPRKH